MNKTSKKKTKRKYQRKLKPTGNESQPSQDHTPISTKNSESSTKATELDLLKERIIHEAIRVAKKEVHHIGYLKEAALKYDELVSM